MELGVCEGSLFQITNTFIQILQELREKIGMLTFPKKGQHRRDEKKDESKSENSDAESVLEHKAPLQRLRPETPCCILSRKPVEKILIR